MSTPVEAFLDALDPDKTKALFMGEFTIRLPEWHQGSVAIVTWSCIKEIQAAIKEQALLNAGWRCRCGSRLHILTIQDRGQRSCCAHRALVPPE